MPSEEFYLKSGKAHGFFINPTGEIEHFGNQLPDMTLPIFNGFPEYDFEAIQAMYSQFGFGQSNPIYVPNPRVSSLITGIVDPPDAA